MSAFSSPVTPTATFYTHDPYAVVTPPTSTANSSSGCIPTLDNLEVSNQSSRSISSASAVSQIPTMPTTSAVSDVMSSVSVNSESVASSAPSTPPTRPVKLTKLKNPSQPAAYALKVQFKYGRKSDFVTEVKGSANIGDHVVVEGDRGIDLGVVVDRKPRFGNTSGSKVKRVATTKDMEQWQACNVAEEEALKTTRKLVQKHRIPITVHMAEFQFDKKKLTFHYSTQASHPDFRALLRASYRTFRCRIWLNNCKPKKNAPGIALEIVKPSQVQG